VHNGDILIEINKQDQCITGDILIEINKQDQCITGYK